MSVAKDRPLKHYAVYARYAASDIASIENQLRAGRKFVAAAGGIVSATYVDNGISGLSLERPQLQNLLMDAKARGISHIIVQDADRISRSPSKLMAVLEDLTAHGVTVHATNRKAHFALTSAASETNPFGYAPGPRAMVCTPQLIREVIKLLGQGLDAKKIASVLNARGGRSGRGQENR